MSKNHDDNNSANYDRVCINQIIRQFKNDGHAFIMTSNKLHAIKKYIKNFEKIDHFDYFTQCTYYEIRRIIE